MTDVISSMAKDHDFGTVVGILIAAFCNSWGNVVLQVMLPQYMRDVLHFDITEVKTNKNISFVIQIHTFQELKSI